MAQVIIKKRNAKSLEMEIKEFLVPLSDKQLFHLSEETVTEIRERIRRSLVREGSTGKLASSFIAEKITEGYGVGRTDYLNQEVPYWHWINYGVAQSGRKVPPVTIGHFDGVPSYPSEHAIKNQKWIHESDEYGYLLIPNKPIDAHNYIEFTVAKIPEMANNILSRIKE